jgi:dTDP-4-dehydrorhamnose reductase
VQGLSSSGKGGFPVLDLRQPDSFDIGRLLPGDVVCLAAAISSPDVCAREPEFARSINVVGTSRFVDRALERGARVIFLSSDTVYGERSQPFDESAPCVPAGAYAAMKHEVERQFIDRAGFKILRLSYVVSARDRFTRYLVSCAERGEEADIFDPFVRAVVRR